MLLASLGCSLLAGCPDRTVSAVYPEQGKVETNLVPGVPKKDVDILFVIDNSGSMAEEQSSLRANFGKFMDVLSTLEGGAPNMHIGVTTSNLGQSASDGTAGGAFGAGCTGSGDGGALRTTPEVTGRFIVDEEAAGGVRNKNYTGTLADAFSSLANVGTNGCGIEQHLGAVQRTLTNTGNAGFLRDNAKLAVIFIADEDDCSLAHKSLFEGTSDGTEVNFRCTREGIECDGGDLSTPGLRQNCEPKIDSAYLNEVDSYVDFVRGLKQFPKEDVIVAGIVGDPDPVEITTDNAGKTVLKPSCNYSGQFAYPAVRTNNFLSQFEQTTRQTICKADLSQAVVEVAALIKNTFDARCFQSDVMDTDPNKPGLQADCTATDMQRLPDGTYKELAVLPSCDSGRIPCWKLTEDPTGCFYTDSKLALDIDRGGAVPAADLYTSVSCVTTATGDGPVM